MLHLWNNPKPAPEYQMGWVDKEAAKVTLEKVLEWDIDRIIIPHGDNIENDARGRLRQQEKT